MRNPFFKIALPAIPVVYLLIAVGLYHEDWRTVICQLPPTMSFWSVVILYYLSIQTSSKKYYGITWFLMVVTLIWFSVAIVSYEFSLSLTNLEIEFIVSAKHFKWSYIPSFVSVCCALLIFLYYEPSLNQHRG